MEAKLRIQGLLVLAAGGSCSIACCALTIESLTKRKGFYSLGAFPFKTGEPGAVVFGTRDVDGNVHVDAVQVLPLK